MMAVSQSNQRQGLADEIQIHQQNSVGHHSAKEGMSASFGGAANEIHPLNIESANLLLNQTVAKSDNSNSESQGGLVFSGRHSGGNKMQEMYDDQSTFSE